MRWGLGVACAAALAGIVPGGLAADTYVYRDAETGFTFSAFNAQYSLGTGRNIVFRIAVPSPVTSNTPYDIVVQVVAPNEVGWAGLAWGGTMTANPLTVGWPSGNNVVITSRRAMSHVLPSAYSGSTFQLFKTGTKKNGTHWQFTAKCTGCSSFTDSSNKQVILNAKGSNRIAFASSPSKPSNPSSEGSSFPVHDVFARWDHDFSSAGNPTFTTLVAKNLGLALPVSSASTSTSSSSSSSSSKSSTSTSSTSSTSTSKSTSTTSSSSSSSSSSSTKSTSTTGTSTTGTSTTSTSTTTGIKTTTSTSSTSSTSTSTGTNKSTSTSTTSSTSSTSTGTSKSTSTTSSSSSTSTGTSKSTSTTTSGTTTSGMTLPGTTPRTTLSTVISNTTAISNTTTTRTTLAF